VTTNGISGLMVSIGVFIFLVLVGAAAEEASSTSFTQQDNTLCGLNRYSTVDRTQGAIIFWLCSMPYDYILDATLF
jgi:hypothetical protein